MLSALEAGSTAEQIALLFGISYINLLSYQSMVVRFPCLHWGSSYSFSLFGGAGPEARARAAVSEHSGGNYSHRSMWDIAAIDDALPSRDGPTRFLRAMLAGATVEFPQVLRRLAQHPTADRFAVPMYVLNYIWDGELRSCPTFLLDKT